MERVVENARQDCNVRNDIIDTIEEIKEEIKEKVNLVWLKYPDRFS